MNGIEPISIIFQQTTCMFNILCWTREGHCICWSADVELCVTGLEHTPSLFWQLLKWIVWKLIVKRKFWVYPKVKGFDRTNLTPVTYACMLLLPWCHIVSGTLASLRKQPFLLAPCHWDIFARRKVCDSVTEIPYWWHKICPEFGQKCWLDNKVVTLS